MFVITWLFSFVLVHFQLLYKLKDLSFPKEAVLTVTCTQFWEGRYWTSTYTLNTYTQTHKHIHITECSHIFLFKKSFYTKYVKPHRNSLDTFELTNGIPINASLFIHIVKVDLKNYAHESYFRIFWCVLAAFLPVSFRIISISPGQSYSVSKVKSCWHCQRSIPEG